MLDKKRILKKLDETMRYVEELEELTPQTFREYEDSLKTRRSCERTLQMVIESVLDVINMLVSGLELGLPSDEEEMIARLLKKNILSKEMGKKLMGMKSTRNFLVHKYGEVKDELIFDNLKDNLGDFELFRKEVVGFLKSK
ncbi:MAG TPA: DUF86 domain-containing protein [Nanoarchaeota archaeon]|nr:DUF86 domain-containing protein [Candidatus Pacearchaeota archaeon]HIH17544.1 DUF86 domain-containing protein [Nanoarchaeota archaeon]HIH34512.1 DUF86 domain-containing protein [Nanoarchaeota archaeon]HIH51515.1 DUF86 domain-containing protein [Nanoarchaeota archaeon]HIH66441.1 DUF86 domain-containing protein [Nanoarchaeota archaeon]